MRVLDRLAELRAADPGRRLFAAHGHQYEIRPPATPDVLGRVEELAGVRLPEDYREFVTAVGDGAPGPYYGVRTLTDVLDQIEEYGDLSDLGRDSPLTGDIDFGELLGQPDEPGEHEARLERDTAYAEGWDALRAEYLSAPWCHGRLPLVDHGCGDWFFLVLRGPRRGTVWVDSVAGSTGLYCLEVDFGTWYGRWLDDAADRVRRNDFAPVDAWYSFLEFGDNPR